MSEHHTEVSSEFKKNATSCCKETKKQTHTLGSWIKQTPLNGVLAILGILLITNIIVMGVFTLKVDVKLSEAIEMTKPQQGTLTVIVPDGCQSCGALEKERDLVSAQHVDLLDSTVVSAGSTEGKSLLVTYEFRRLPAMVFMTEERMKPTIKKVLEDTGTVIDDRTIVWQDTLPPYVNTQNNAVVGLVDAIYITDETCADCYDVRQAQRSILGRYGVVLQNEQTVDISSAEGQEIQKTYAITQIPTVVLSPATAVYGALANVWPQVGTVAPDGSYVFRKNAAIGDIVYKDLSTSEIIRPDTE